MAQSARIFSALLFVVGLLCAEEAKWDQPPEVIEKIAPVYPPTMATFATPGYVTFDVVVTEQGWVVRPQLVACSHFEFELPGVEAALQWKFKPATRSGVAVVSRARITLQFFIEKRSKYLHELPRASFVVPPVSPADYPVEFQYDSPPRLYLQLKAVYPRGLLEKNVKGAASMVFLVDPSGRPRRIEVLEATRPEFGAAAKAMIASWRFNPAAKDGKATWTTLAFKQHFDQADRDSPLNEGTKRMLKKLRGSKAAIVTDVRQLDAVPEPRYQPEPQLPDSVAKAGLPVNATIEILIDQDGHVQMPRVLDTNQEDFGWAAATAVARWLFSPPMKGENPWTFLCACHLPINRSPIRSLIQGSAEGRTILGRGLAVPIIACRNGDSVDLGSTNVALERLASAIQPIFAVCQPGRRG